jgi:hypothetical protein
MNDGTAMVRRERERKKKKEKRPVDSLVVGKSKFLQSTNAPLAHAAILSYEQN